MPEAIRLVIWDLDETFWRGTVTEGGIREYVQAHHDIVVELARRGIVSSICSKNDAAAIMPILASHGIAAYFVFPSIAWEPKGPRLAATINAMGLRPATVMFIDDHPGNRAEASALLPDLQVESENFIPHILADPRFRGKDDRGLTRLAQYKLLETRARDAASAPGGNEEFLRGCDIRVRIEHDVAAHLDRAIELINRTNQLNFTKARLPEKPEDARASLSEALAQHHHQAGLIHVTDRYGDYGFVGFYLVRRPRWNEAGVLGKPLLLHFCFSCRTLGMHVEHFVYEHLGRPTLRVVGAVLTDVTVPRDIDWIRLDQNQTAKAATTPKLATEIRIHGGCEVNSIAHYLGQHADSIRVSGNFRAGHFFVRMNSAAVVQAACDHGGAAFAAEAAYLGIPYDLLAADYFDNAADGTIFILNAGLDGTRVPRYRHTEHGWELALHLVRGAAFQNLVTAQEEALAQSVTRLNAAPEEAAHLTARLRHIRAHYEAVPPPEGKVLRHLMLGLFARVPDSCRLILILNDDRMRDMSGTLRRVASITRYNRAVRAVAAGHARVAVIEFADAIHDERDIRAGGNHYDRMVYCRVAEAIVAAARERVAAASPVGDNAHP